MSKAKRQSKSTHPVRRFLGFLRPGFITGASDDDPSGIGTCAMAGASTGFSTLWLALATLPMMGAIQFICAKIAMVTGKGLAGALTENKPDEAKKLYWILAISTAAAIEINFLGINPVSALLWAAVINGLLAPP